MTDEQTRLSRLPCPVCGGKSYSWGEIVASNLAFKPEDAFFLSKMFSAGWSLPARRCDDCGNVQFFTDAPKGEE